MYKIISIISDAGSVSGVGLSALVWCWTGCWSWPSDAGRVSGVGLVANAQVAQVLLGECLVLDWVPPRPNCWSLETPGHSPTASKSDLQKITKTSTTHTFVTKSLKPNHIQIQDKIEFFGSIWGCTSPQFAQKISLFASLGLPSQTQIISKNTFPETLNRSLPLASPSQTRIILLNPISPWEHTSLHCHSLCKLLKLTKITILKLMLKLSQRTSFRYELYQLRIIVLQIFSKRCAQIRGKSPTCTGEDFLVVRNLQEMFSSFQ